MTFDTTSVTIIAVALFIGGLLIVFGSLIAERLKKVETPYPAESEIKAALEEWAHKAIHAGLTIVQEQIATVDNAVNSPTALNVAYAAYHALPAAIVVGQWVLPIADVKEVVSESDWQALVRRILGEADHFLRANETFLANKAKDYAPPVTTQPALTSLAPATGTA